MGARTSVDQRSTSTDEPAFASSSSQQSGGVNANVTEDSHLTVVGDIVGRDKITNYYDDEMGLDRTRTLWHPHCQATRNWRTFAPLVNPA